MNPMSTSTLLVALSDANDKLCEKLTLKKLQELFDIETKKVMTERSVLLHSSSPASDSKVRRGLHREKTYAVEHRMELLNRVQDEESIHSSHEHARNIAQYGEQRVVNQIEANIKAMVESVPSLSAQILARRSSVRAAFDGPDFMQNIADTSFGTLRQYYTTCQEKLNAKYNVQEKTFLQYELDGMERQYKAMEEILTQESKSMGTSTTAQQSHKRCDELYRRFCDRMLELQYGNSTIKQDFEWRFHDARDAANKWRYATSDVLETELRCSLGDIEDRYMTIVENLSSELVQLRQVEQEASLELLRLQNLSKIPPFALRVAEQVKEQEQIARLEDGLKQGMTPEIMDDGGDISEGSINIYRVHAGSHLVELANAAKLPAEQLSNDLQQMLVSIVRKAGTSKKDIIVQPQTRSGISNKSQLEHTLAFMLQKFTKESKETKEAEMTNVQFITSPIKGKKFYL